MEKNMLTSADIQFIIDQMENYRDLADAVRYDYPAERLDPALIQKIITISLKLRRISKKTLNEKVDVTRVLRIR